MLLIELILAWMAIGAMVWFTCTAILVEYLKKHGDGCEFDWDTIGILNGMAIWPTLIANTVRSIKLLKEEYARSEEGS